MPTTGSGLNRYLFQTNVLSFDSRLKHFVFIINRTEEKDIWEPFATSSLPKKWSSFGTTERLPTIGV